MSRQIATVGVAGAGGTMGAGIAIVAARAGFTTVAYDLEHDALVRARQQTEDFFAKSIERGRLSAERRDTILAGLVHTTDLAELGQC
ncbi:MAG TPA: 3-hydroxyacyl-CoA dehydrogenase NAD-binding domain-containing protein, partial [Geminicoccaceae bacterium]|nr:3-hydroxyacyl-CoA dehydrogenase NAD-binding domain-containing protein [Geminicoccaceae bacterium]